MKKLSFSILMQLCCFMAFSQMSANAQNLRATAYPLVTIDPYTSAWSFSDKLYDDDVRHWTGARHSFVGALRVDGVNYRFMGTEKPILKPLVSTAAMEAWVCKYTNDEPKQGWEKKEYDDRQWKEGKAAFGTAGMPNLRTPWETKDIWVRREVVLKEDPSSMELYLEYSHDDNFEMYVNGVEVVNTGYAWKNNVRIPLPEAAKKTLVVGKNIFTAHCHNMTGGAMLDFGLFTKVKQKQYFEKTADQKSVQVMPTSTNYTFACGPVALDLRFTSPLLMNQLDVLSRPVSYVTYSTKSMDGKSHDVQIYFEATPEWAIDSYGQAVASQKVDANGLVLLKAGAKTQNVLGRKGDDVCIDWGYFYLGGKSNKDMSVAINDSYSNKKDFSETGKLTGQVNKKLSGLLMEQMVGLSVAQNLGNVGQAEASGHVLIGYDDIYSIQYMNDNCRAWWNADGKHTIVDAFTQAETDYSKLMSTCAAFDADLMANAQKAGGAKYAELCALAYRQAIAAHKLIKDKNGNLLFFSKENFSNGCINTVDVTYPSAPLFLIYNPDLLKGMMNAIFEYSESGKWTKPFAAHDMGTYPLANGQLYGEDMPVEEAGNMMILAAGIAAVEGNAAYAEKHWKVLTVWADYLLKNGLDPENQLCTDDFAGHLAHNTNLSIKAILGIASYGKLAQMLGKNDVAQQYTAAAREMATKWIAMANDNDHFSLTFDKKGTWSQKYNLVWDKVLNLNIFPKEVAQKEIAFYLGQQKTYGLPLDSRASYTKSDWILWTACLSDNIYQFQQFIDPVYKYVNESPSRVPLSDWHETPNAKQVGFQARSVVGGYYFKMLDQKLNGNR